MDEFRTIARHWPSGDELDLGEDGNQTTIESSFLRDASSLVADPNGGPNLQFLFWNTGRRITNKRKVRWNFSVGGWGTWTATRWYGVPGGTTGAPRIHLTSYSIREDRPLTGTPLNAAASWLGSSPPPLGAPAYPAGDDRTIDSEAGPVHLAAISPYQEQGDDTSHTFSGWLRLTFGGDPIGEFVETDTGFDVNDSNTTSFYQPFGGLIYHAGANESAELLAAYGVAVDPRGGGGGFNPLILRELWEALRQRGSIFDIIDPVFDPSPLDRLRLGRLEALLRQVRGEQPAAATPAAEIEEDFLSRVEKMTGPEVKRAITEVQSRLRRGEAALKALESIAKRSGKG